MADATTHARPRRRRGRAKLVLSAVLLCALGAGLWWGFFRTVQAIQTEPVRRASIENAVTALGVLQPQRYVDVGAQVSGQIKRIAVKPGDKVAKGDLLLEIDPALQQATVQTNRATLASLRAQLAEQEAQRDLARQQSERQQQMAAEGSTRLEDVQTAQATLRIALARIESLKAQIEGAQSTLAGNEALLGYTRIYAPIAGTVVTLDAREGQTLNATYQTPNVMRIADLSRMTVWTEVSEADVGRIRPGMPVYFTTLGLQDKDGRPRRWQGSLRQVLPAPPTAPGAAPATGQSAAPAGKVVLYTALFDVDNQDGALMPQMSAQVFFVAASAKDVLVAPLAALAPVKGEAGRFTAQVLAGEELQRREVRIGVRDRLLGEVLDGLKDGEQLVTAIKQEQPRIASLLALCREEEPELEIRVFEMPFLQQLKGLHNDLLDVGFALSNAVNEGLVAEAVWTDPLSVVVPARHPLLAYGQIKLGDALKFPLVLCHPEAGSGCHHQIEAVLEGAAVTPKVADRVTSLGVMLTLVGAGYGVGFAIGSQMQSLQRPDIAIRPFAGTPPTLSTYLLRRNVEPSEPLKRFMQRTRQMSGPKDDEAPA